MSTLPDPLTVEALAELVADPTWRDAAGRNLIVALMAAYPDDGAARWTAAVDLFEARHGETSRRLRSDQWLQLVASSHVDRGSK